ncbi:flagellar FliL protein [Salsuginibacillus halophilus]|uniref:Flagellar protein FliL n=1 Tax=Salsuginibacillus halophilus TaxID=517424 RepID=A0A2P8HY83_9BACI|nr:flagellar basal body-associated protein FliL [Salsuginibacillus halophilus]PSL51198.1 flagellar FliL protein [Salsuginibacillus halophilus]
MFKNRLVTIMLIIIIALTLIGVVTLVLINQFAGGSSPDGEPTIDEIIEQSWETEEITTNLDGNEFIRARFRIHVDSTDAREELEQRDFQVNNVIIRELADKSPQELTSGEGIDELESQVRLRLNELLDEGSVIRVYTTERMIQ